VTTLTNLVSLSDQTIAPAGGDQPHNNLMPYLTMNFCIAFQGSIHRAPDALERGTATVDPQTPAFGWVRTAAGRVSISSSEDAD
jgi:hypothetical protein